MKIRSNDIEQQAVIDRVYESGQEQVLRFWPELDDSSRTRLIDQLREIDFKLIRELNQKFIQSETQYDAGHLEPADFIPVPETPDELSARQQAKEVGEEALRQGRLAAFLVAGGQGTRLGFGGPKGKFVITPIKKKSLFQLHAEKILALSRKYDASIPWYIMTSETNHEESVAFFDDNSYFGLNAEDVIFFRQEMIPALDPQSRLILDAKDHIFKNPNGHGGSLSALKNTDALQNMNNRGIDFVFYFQVDNVLIKMCDPVFIGNHIQNQAQMSAKVVVKTDPHEKIGVIGRIDGKLGVIEYSDLPQKEQEARNSDGTLKFRGGSIAIHVFNRDFIEQKNAGGLQLPWHVAHKKIPYLNETGELVTPEQPNAFKFETFVFDALQDAERTVILEVERSKEFSPVKSAAGMASPASAQRDMNNLFGSWLEKAGVAIPLNSQNNLRGEIEISPLFAIDEHELAGKLNSDFRFEGQLYLG